MLYFNNKFIDTSKLGDLGLSVFKQTNFELNTYSGSLLQSLKTNGNSKPLLVKKRYLKLIDIWNKILFSGFYKFTTSELNNYNLLCQNNLNNKIEYFTRDTNGYKLGTSVIFDCIKSFLIGIVTESNNSDAGRDITDYPDILKEDLNENFDVTTILPLCDELFSLLKECIDKDKYFNETTLVLDNLNFTNNKDIIPSLPDYNLINNETNFIYDLKPTAETNLTSEISKVYIKDNKNFDGYITSATLFNYQKPLEIIPKVTIDTSNNNDSLYIYFYNGTCLFQNMNDEPVAMLSALVYSIGPSDPTDPDYFAEADIKLKFEKNMSTFKYINYLDNLVCFNKIY